MPDFALRGMPGVGSVAVAEHRLIFRQASEMFLAGGKVIDGSKSRDPGNTGYLSTLRPGLLMGKATSGGEYRPAIIGVTTQAEIAGATSITVSAAVAVEIVRRIGTTGTLRLVSPPSAAGVVTTFTETYSAVNTTTGVITCSALDAAIISGAFVCADDGTHNPVAFIPDGTGVKVVDADGNDIDEPFPKIPISGVVDSSQLLPAWPSDTSLQSWLVSRLNNGEGGQYVFDHRY